MQTKIDKQRVYALLREIPRGKVVTYGELAVRLGNPRWARAVGAVLHRNPDGEKYPCYKVVDRCGALSVSYAFGGLEEQKRRLLAEGIAVENGRVELARYGYSFSAPRNPYLRELRKIEFVVTDACTGQCRHCSQGAHPAKGTRIDPCVAAQAVRRIAARYSIETVMTFGGEPLLHPEAVLAVMRAAREMGVRRRQVITNGYFSRDPESIRAMAKALCAAGVNDLLLSVDAFHQETVPLETVKLFAQEALSASIPLRLSPAWLLSSEDRNPYNEKTRQILRAFDGMGIPVGEGNMVFPEGNAVRYLAEYFRKTVPPNPYEEDPYSVRCVSFSPNGDVLGDNVYCRDILEILENYTP